MKIVVRPTRNLKTPSINLAMLDKYSNWTIKILCIGSCYTTPNIILLLTNGSWSWKRGILTNINIYMLPSCSSISREVMSWPRLCVWNGSLSRSEDTLRCVHINAWLFFSQRLPLCLLGLVLPTSVPGWPAGVRGFICLLTIVVMYQEQPRIP